MPDRPVAPDRRDPPRARSGDIAVREEFDAAITTRSADALSVFIARHPGHPLASAAEAARRDLLERR